MHDRPPLSDPSSRTSGRAALLLFVVVLAVYAPALRNSFLLNWDDGAYVVENEVAHGLTTEHVAAAFTRFFVGNYAPVQIVSYMLDHEAWGLRAWGYVLTNVVLHGASAVLFLVLLTRVLRNATQAWVAALLWAVHPVQVESVAWISQRKSVLAMFFFLASFAAWVRHRDGVRPRCSYVAALLAFVLALLSKSVAVILPPLLVLFEVTHPHPHPHPRRGVKLVLDKIPFFVAALTCGLLAAVSQVPSNSSGRTAYLGGDLSAWAFTMVGVLTRYVQLVFAPAGLSAAYDPPIRAWVDGSVVVGFVLLAVLVAAGVVLWFGRRGLFFWYALFFVALLPVAQLFPLVTLINDRYLYFPLLGVAPLAAQLLVGSSPVRRLARPVALAVGLALALASVARLQVWRNDVTLWSDAVIKAPHSADAWFALGNSLSDAGREDEAEEAFLHVLALDPDYAAARLNLGAVGLARAHARLTARAAAGAPSPDDLLMLGATELLLGRLDGAASAFSSAAHGRHARAALFGLGTARLMAFRLTEARGALALAASVEAPDAKIEYQRARVEALAGDRAAALRFLRSALRLGYKDRAMVSGDGALASIRSTPEFDALVTRFFGHARPRG